MQTERTVEGSKYLKLTDLTLNEKNPRTIEDDNFKKLIRDIKEDPKFLEKRPVLVYIDPISKEKVVYAGNMRVRAAKALGLTEIPVTIDYDITEGGVINRPLLNRRIFEDNETYGQYDKNMLINNFDMDELKKLDFPELNQFLDFSMEVGELSIF